VSLSPNTAPQAANGKAVVDNADGEMISSSPKTRKSLFGLWQTGSDNFGGSGTSWMKTIFPAF
jgi:hypothetical protein